MAPSPYNCDNCADTDMTLGAWDFDETPPRCEDCMLRVLATLNRLQAIVYKHLYEATEPMSGNEIAYADQVPVHRVYSILGQLMSKGLVVSEYFHPKGLLYKAHHQQFSLARSD